jgi:hypothetical protein
MVATQPTESNPDTTVTVKEAALPVPLTVPEPHTETLRSLLCCLQQVIEALNAMAPAGASPGASQSPEAPQSASQSAAQSPEASLEERYKDALDRIKAGNPWIIENAVLQYNNYQLLHWLAEQDSSNTLHNIYAGFKVPVETSTSVLATACDHGSVDVVRYLVANAGLSKDHLCDRKVLTQAVMSSEIDVVAPVLSAADYDERILQHVIEEQPDMVLGLLKELDFPEAAVQQVLDHHPCAARLVQQLAAK